MMLLYNSLIVDKPAQFLLWKQQMDPERSLIERVIQGDIESWQKFILKYYKLKYAAISRYIRDDDEKMSAYVYVLEKFRENEFARFRTFRFESSLSTWITIVVRRLTQDFLRIQYGRNLQRKDDRTMLLDENKTATITAEENENPEKRLLQKEMEKKRNQMICTLSKVIAGLDSKETMLIKLIFIYHMKWNEAGKILHLKSVYKYKQQLLKKLRIQLQEKAPFTLEDLNLMLSGEKG